MSAQSQNGYMLIFRGTDWHKGLSPEDMQKVSDQWMAWFKRLTEEGKAIAGNPLERDGRMVSGKDGRVVLDGPFTESKDAIAGYFLLKVNRLDEAVAIAREVRVCGMERKSKSGPSWNDVPSPAKRWRKRNWPQPPREL